MVGAADGRGMDASDALSGLSCTACDSSYETGAGTGRCPDCTGVLEPVYDLGRVQVASADRGADAAGLLERTGLDALLPLESSERSSLGRGETPLLEATGLAATLDVGEVSIKSEGCNPTGSIADREMVSAVAAATARDAGHVALPTTGNGGLAAAAAAASAGLAAHVFVPSRSPFATKAMINVHGGDMTVVEGRHPDAVSAFESAVAGEPWYSLAPFDEPFRAEGIKPVAYEIAAARGWSTPDRVVVPTGHTTPLVGLFRGFRELADLGLVDDVPRLDAAQADGCAPLVDAIDAGADEPTPVERPDTVCGSLEVPDPAGGRLALGALAETGGTAIAVADEDLLLGATDLAETGVPTSVEGGAGVAAVRSLGDAGKLDGDEEVVLIDPVSAERSADLLRSHLMSRGR